ncbi:MAG: exosome complex protein Rrp42 [Candidatus Pacearchaeota archaeon]|jgi:exosome complex component RRP42
MELPNINKRQIENLLEKGKRLDGRKPFDYRDITIEKNISKNAEGSARVKIGKTDVIVGVKLATQEPYPDHEDEGTMTTNMEYSPASGSRYESGPPKMDSVETARVVDRGIRESGFIDWKKLCIEPGKKVWSVSIDIYSINDDGNILDASAIGAMAALKLTRFPEYDKETESVKFGEFTDTPLPLTEKTPFSMTFYKVGNNLLVDPNRDEEDAAEARLTLAISKPSKDHIINAMQKGGITPLTGEELKKIVEQAEKVYEHVYPEIEKQLKKK